MRSHDTCLIPTLGAMRRGTVSYTYDAWKTSIHFRARSADLQVCGSECQHLGQNLWIDRFGQMMMKAGPQCALPILGLSIPGHGDQSCL